MTSDFSRCGIDEFGDLRCSLRARSGLKFEVLAWRSHFFIFFLGFVGRFVPLIPASRWGT